LRLEKQLCKLPANHKPATWVCICTHTSCKANTISI
jgi:hypothetical protein